jgi:uncharacterized protein (TIGR02611 family)
VATPKEVLVWIGRNGRRLGVSVVGAILILAGLAGLALPLLPGWLLIIAGLAVLATEYTWAERALDAAKQKARSAASKARQKMRRGKSDLPRD